MNNNQFLKGLIASYPPEVRPDAEYVEQISQFLERRGLSSQELEDAYEVIRVTFRRFPSISDIAGCFTSAHAKAGINKESEKAYEYFTIKGYSYRRDVQVNRNGVIQRKPLPEDAEDYVLYLPRHMRHDRDYISLDQAIEMGVVPYKAKGLIKAMSSGQMVQRFEKIGREIRSDEEYIDDSMAANPEPEHFAFDDL